MEDSDYIINKKSKASYEVHKFLFGSYNSTYRLYRKNGTLNCSCIGHRCRKTCKHKDWVGLLESKKPLPENVVESEEPNFEEIV